MNTTIRHPEDIVNNHHEYINLGCGQRYHHNWTNVDFKSFNNQVIAHDLNHSIPFNNNSFKLAYSSHLLEHLTRIGALNFLNECHRILIPGGVIRIAVPDLESIAKTYIQAIERASAGEDAWINNYEWMIIELLDQMTRVSSGGQMFEYLQNYNIKNEDFIYSRCGQEVKSIRDKFLAQCTSEPQRHQGVNFDALVKTSTAISKIKKLPAILKEKLYKLILDKEYEALTIGRFKLSGETHQWMYDSYSLGRLLRQCGFRGITQRTAYDSYIKDWPCFNLDTNNDGKVYKPDSIYMEAIK